MESVAQKRCSVCLSEKDLSAFPIEKRCRDGRAARCKNCQRDYQKRWSDANKDRVLEYHAKYRQEHRELYSISTKKWNEKNLDKHREYVRRYIAAHKDHYRELGKRWNKANRGRINKQRLDRYRKDPTKAKWNSKIRRFRKKASGGDHTMQEWQMLCKQYNNRCLSCGSNGPLTEDHIIPISLGGSNNIDNIQPLCVSCNSKKGTHMTDYRR